jgi:hypothetical protein
MSEPEHEPTQELIPGLELPMQGPVHGPEPEPALQAQPAGVGELLDLLSSPLDDDDLTAVLTRRPRAKLPSMTLALAAIVVLSAGFLVGAMVGKHYGNSGSSNLAAEFRGLAATRAGASASPSAGASGAAGSGFAGRGGAFGAGNATVGTIKLIDGATVYVQTTAGDIVQVATSAGTKVTVSTTVPVKDLQPGETVIVEGSKNSKGGIAATSISQTTLGAGFGG